jgi:hypothetical protein
VTLTVTGITASNQAYDGNADATIDASHAALTGVLGTDDVALDTSGATGSFATKDAVTGQAVTISGLVLTGSDAGNYVLTAPTASADITRATLTVTGITTADKAFDGTTDATVDTTNARLVGVVPDDQVSLDASAAVGAFETPDAGTDKTVFITGLAIVGADSGNYTLSQPTTTASIT